MTELLTHEEYRSLAAAMDLPQNAWIDGGYRPAISGKTFETVNPATGAVLGTVAACDAADVDLAVQKAREAFEDGRWSRLHPTARKDVLVRLAKLLERNARELAVMESVDSGKTIYDCENVDIPETIHVIKWHGELIDKIYDQVPREAAFCPVPKPVPTMNCAFALVPGFTLLAFSSAEEPLRIANVALTLNLVHGVSAIQKASHLQKA